MRPFRFLVAAALALAGGCSTLPESAAPKGSLVDASSLDSGDLIPYRKLSRADFRGTKAPPEFAAVADRVGAATCGRVVTLPDTQIVIRGVEKPNGERRYWGEVKNLAFRALMDRNCSWWNDATAEQRPDYVLEHEQIHFAIFELGARRLNAEAAAIAEKMATEGSTLEEVQEHANQVQAEAMERALKEILERSHAFDEDTSLGFKPEKQKAWLARVTAELEETRRWAR